MTIPICRISAVLLISLALALSGCGRKGSLRAPEGEESEYTGLGTYPAPESVVPQAGGSATDEETEPESDAESSESP